MARGRAAPGGDRGGRPRARAAAPDLSRVRRRAGALGRAGASRRRSCEHADADGLAREDRWARRQSTDAGRRALPRDALAAPAVDDELDEDDDHRALSGPRPGARRRPRRRRRAPPRGERRHRHLRRHAQRQLHERLLLPLRLLRLLEGQAGREPARPALPRAARRDRPPLPRGLGARRGRGLPPGRDPPRLHGRLLRRGRARRSSASCRTCTCTPSPRSRSGRAPRRSACRSTTTSRGCATPGSPRCRARPPRSSTTRSARPLPGQGQDGAVARGARDGAPGRAALDDDDHVRLTSTRRAAGRATCCASASSSSAPAASPSSCRCRSCTWRRRSTSRAARAPGRPSARRCSCTRSRGSRSIRGSRTSRPPGSSSAVDGRAGGARAGANDLGGTLMNESISRAAGAATARRCRPSGWRRRSARSAARRGSGRRSTALRRRSARGLVRRRRRSPSRSTRA